MMVQGSLKSKIEMTSIGVEKLKNIVMSVYHDSIIKANSGYLESCILSSYPNKAHFRERKNVKNHLETLDQSNFHCELGANIMHSYYF